MDRRSGLIEWGWDDGWEGQLPRSDSDESVGRVTTRDRSRWTVQIAEGQVDARSVAEVRDAPAVGDWVTLVPGPAASDPWSITGMLPRRSKFSRQAAGGETAEQVVAANVDRVWIVHGLDVGPNPRRLERYVAVAWESGAQPEIVLTKADVAVDLVDVHAVVGAVAVGVPVWTVSSSVEPGFADLAESLEPGTTIALLGPSGVGKSTLINSLAGEQVLAVGEVRAGDRKGRHTTTRRQLVRIPGGALLLDTPGMRELQVWQLDEGLQQAFPEIDELASACRFRDCTHRQEPGCAVLAAVADGKLAEDRLAGFRKLMAEADYQRRKVDPVARAEEESRWKSIMKTLKHHPKYGDRA